MEPEYTVVLDSLLAKRDLTTSKATPLLDQQLREQGRHSSNTYRYQVVVEVIEGKRRPAADVDNYAKKVLDAITKTHLLWQDDEQIDTLEIRRVRDRRRQGSQITVRISATEGQHSGAPSFFRARCAEARSGPPYSYADPGYVLASSLGSEQPYDLTIDEWQKRVEKLLLLLDDADDSRIWAWFYEHFPRCMRLVPSRRMEQFVSGVRRAYEKDEICL